MVGISKGADAPAPKKNTAPDVDESPPLLRVADVLASLLFSARRNTSPRPSSCPLSNRFLFQDPLAKEDADVFARRDPSIRSISVQYLSSRQRPTLEAEEIDCPEPSAASLSEPNGADVASGSGTRGEASFDGEVDPTKDWVEAPLGETPQRLGELLLREPRFPPEHGEERRIPTVVDEEGRPLACLRELYDLPLAPALRVGLRDSPPGRTRSPIFRGDQGLHFPI
jgi:hypothetical protein